MTWTVTGATSKGEKTMKVKGEIGRTDTGHIFYTDGQDVYVAPGYATVGTNGYLAGGRWECTLDHYNHYRNTVYEHVND